LTLTLICFFLDEWTKPTTLTSLCFFMDEWIKPMRLTLLLIFHGWIKPLAFTLFLFFHGWKTNDGPPWLKQKLTWTIIEHMIMSWFHALCRYYRKCHSQLDSPRAEKGHKNWENKLTKSISIGAQYVTPPHSKNYCEKVKMCRFSSRNSFFRTKFVQLLAVAAAQYFWLDHIMIGPCGLQLVVPTYLQFQIQFYWWVCHRINS
jgi:hypothetical protein